jgi:uncharacterized protein HemX
MREESHESTTVILKKIAPGLAWLPKAVRDRLTPASVWSVLAALTIGIGFVINAHQEIRHHDEAIAELKKSRDDMRASRDADHELLSRIDTRLAVMETKIDAANKQLDSQSAWRAKIEDGAEIPIPNIGTFHAKKQQRR